MTGSLERRAVQQTSQHTDARRGPPRTGWHAAGLTLLLCGHIGVSCALDLDEETSQLLVEAVETATQIDLYNERCRGDVSGRVTDNLNKAMISKLRVTVLSVQDDLFPEHSYRRAQKRLKADFLARLRDLGGCQGAKEAELPEALGRRYQEHLEAIRALP